MTHPKAFDRRLRLGIVGGGGMGSIGPSHIAGARLDGRWDIVAGAFSRDHERTKAVAKSLFIDPDRAYTDYVEMASQESDRPDRIDAVTVCTNNDTHYEIVDMFLSKGFHVICDKPLTIDERHADALAAKAAEANLILAVTYTYSAYPMVRMAREFVASGRLGKIESVQVEYSHQYQANDPATQQSPKGADALDGLGVVAALGSHAFHLAEFVSGLRVAELAADMAGIRHSVDDHVNMLLRFEGGARGSLWTTTIAHGSANGLSLRIYGTNAGLTWHQEAPEQFVFTESGRQPVLFTRGGPEATVASRALTRIPAGHPEGYLEAFANIYSAVADAVWAGRSLPEHEEFPSAREGARGVAFMFAALRSSKAGSSFVSLPKA